jgi:hypothetical protein
MRGYAVRAYAEAQRREREAKSTAEAENWRRAALTIAEKTDRRAGFDTAARMVADISFAHTNFVPKASAPRAL